MRIVLADDHPFYLDALERQLSKAFRGAKVQGFPSFEELCSALRDASADLVILDFSLSGTQADDPIRQVVALAGNAPVIIISGVANAADVQDCVAAGVRGYLPKTMPPRLFTDAVSLILHGGTYLPIESALTRPATAQPRKAEPDNAGSPALDARDRDLLRMIADGLSNKEIARCMDVQEATIKFYVSRLFRRLGVKNRSQAVSWTARAETAS
jgi:two-component system, NarL family, nitrate/nitrite response regulator NarL